MNADYCGWVANVAFIAGTLLLAYKDRRGFIVCTVGNICYFATGYLSSLNSVMLLNVAMFSLNWFSYYNWRTK